MSESQVLVFQKNPINKSEICRICGEENEHGELLFYSNQDIQKQAVQICSYIKIKLKYVRYYPNWICPGCRLQLESTSQFFELIRNGQKLINERFGIQPKRGRLSKRKRSDGVTEIHEIQEPPLDLDIKLPDGRKRSSKTPSRLKDSMQGNELEELYSDMGIARRPAKEPKKNSKPKLIAHIQSQNGVMLGDMLAIPENPQRTCTRYQCDICKEYFIKDVAFFEHVSMHQNVRYECKECEKSFLTKLLFDEHQAIENHKELGIIETPFTNPPKPDAGDVPNDCNVEPIVVQKPMKKKSASKFLCIKCDKAFQTKNAVKRHQITHSQSRAFKCGFCAATFKNKSVLTIHRRIHTGERSFQCTKCPKSFTHKQTLKSHLRSHDGLKPYLCTICKKSYSQLGALQEHRRIHTGERPYVCLICGTSFKTSSQCRVHQRAHIIAEERLPKTVEFENIYKTHSCKVCSKLFSHRSAMIKHLRIHTGEKPYACHLCPKRFADPSNFKKHKRAHTINTETSKAKFKTPSLLKHSLFSNLDPDPDPDGLLSMNSMAYDSFIPPTRSCMDLIDEDNDRGSKAWGLLRESSDPIITEIHNDDSSMMQQQQPISNQVVCISYQDPLNPVSNKTTFYVVN